MTDPIQPAPFVLDPFLLAYKGGDADEHILDTEALGESLIGASRFYIHCATYATYGYVQAPKKRKREFKCYAQATTPGSLEQWLILVPVAVQYLPFFEAHKPVIKLVLEQIAGTLKKIFVKPSESKALIELLGKTLDLQAQNNEAFQAQLSIMAGGLVKANDNASAITMKLLETLPELIDAARPSARKMVAPIGDTCTSITQFANTKSADVITESEAEVIRGDSEMEVDPVASFKVNQISEININTGHCILAVDGINVPITGKITDPVLSQPGNIYTKALSDHSGLSVQAKAVKKAGHIHRLYISNAN